MKILISGPLDEESLENLKARVSELHSGKHGPFDLLLIIPGLAILENTHFQDFPIKVILFESSKPFVEFKNVKVQFAYGPPPLKPLSSVDILLSSDLPENSGAPNPLHASKVTSSWALLTSPRYHFCGGSSQFFQRAPYRNEKGKPVTRLIALCPVGSSEKWLHALNLPAEISIVEPEGTTVNPYMVNIETVSSPPSFFFAKESSTKADTSRKKAKLENKKTKTRIPPRLDCWFCLASPTCEKHLISFVGEELYITLPKGGIIMEHALLVPISHEESFSKFLQSDEGLDEADQLISRLEKTFAKNGYAMMFIDRSLIFDKAPQQHAYVEALPVPVQAIDQMETVMIEQANLLGITLKPIGGGLGSTTRSNLEEIRKLDEYLFLQFPGGKAFVFNGKSSTFEDSKLRNGLLQFGRMIVCELLRCPEKVNWKSCIASKQQETTWAKGLQTLLKPE